RPARLSYLSFSAPPGTPALYLLSLHDALPIYRAERDFAGAFQRQLERHLARMVAGKFQRHDLKRPLDRSEIGQDQLPIADRPGRSEEHTSELQSRENLVCRLLLEKKKERSLDR